MMEFIKYHGETVDIWYMLSFHLSKQLQYLAAIGHNDNLKNKNPNNYRYTQIYALFYDKESSLVFSIASSTVSPCE